MTSCKAKTPYLINFVNNMYVPKIITMCIAVASQLNTHVESGIFSNG